MLCIDVGADHGRSRVEFDARKHRPPGGIAKCCKPLAPLDLHRLRALHEPPRFLETDHSIDREVAGCIAQPGHPVGDEHFSSAILAAGEGELCAEPVVDPEQHGGGRRRMRGVLGRVVSHVLNLMSSLVRFNY